jgi:serine protease
MHYILKSNFIKVVFKIFLFISIVNGYAQQSLNYMPGELLLRFKDQVNPNYLIGDATIHPISKHILSLEIISSRLNIYRLQYDHPQISESEIKVLLNGYEDLITIQRNHVGDFRNTPNDQFFSDQWYLNNIGQNNGIPGADIQILNVWNKLESGTTIYGDTIVIAIIDAGFDRNHEDLSSNFWINQNEIPDNGIDDDNNGYIDDVYGWNATNRSEDMSSNGSHGTNVSGIIGATGNNTIGLTGINWNIKIMPVILEFVLESTVIEAYEYVLIQRIRYNETQGKSGAFVVATNSSWGLDFGKPENAPLWCAFYDEMGQHGILNVAATANRSVNVDEVGDLPTACPSEFLLSVTSSNRYDQRANAAFGKNSIDIAAPGESIMVARSHNRYSISSGTSYASPMVTGTIGLLYAYNCPILMKKALENPGEAALLVKKAITNGAFQLPAFATNTISGGRLNVQGAFDIIDEICSICATPELPILDEFGINSLRISWSNDNADYESFNIRYQENGSGIWTELFDVQSPYIIDQLLSCTYYDVELQGVCPGGELSPFTDTQIFRTDSCCEGPILIDTFFVQPNASRIFWQEVLPADSYLISYKPVQDSIWEDTSTTQTQFLIRNLIFCTEYEIKIASICQLDTSEYSEIYYIKTKGCGACTEKVYCTTGSGQSEQLFIHNVRIVEFENESEFVEDGYEDFTGQEKAAGERGKRYPITIQWSTSQEEPLNHIGVWIDYNHDGIFDEDEERALYLLNYGDTSVTRNIVVPLYARIGTTRMRIGILDADMHDTLLACNQFPFYGEYEDYCFEVLPQECSPTPLLDTLFVGFNSATFEWIGVEEAIAYTFRYKDTLDSEWIEELSDTIKTWMISDLRECSTYEFEVRTVCLFDTSAYVNYTFDTRCPTNIKEWDQNNISIRAFPNPYSDIIYFEIKLEDAGALAFKVYNTLGASVLSRRIDNVQRDHFLEISELSHLPPGIYFVEIQSGNRRTTFKIQRS